MSNRIRLYRTDREWMAKFDGPHATEIQRLFETDTIPTAFTEKAEASTVQARIQALNPDCQVTVLEPIVPWGDRK